jgi:Contractile injection system tube protein/LysM domain
MALEKLMITPLSKNGIPLFHKRVKVLFNPSEYTVSKSVSWDSESKKDRRFNAPSLTFEGGGSRQLTLKLFYDVTESSTSHFLLDVRRETNKLAAFARINRKLERPPVLLVSWGIAPIGSDFPFIGVITSLSQTFVLFSANGRPLRANVDVTLQEYLRPEMDKRETDPELTTYRIKRGDSFANISAEMYGDPAQWRLIVEANGLDDPRNLDIGRVLSIPEIS